MTTTDMGGELTAPRRFLGVPLAWWVLLGCVIGLMAGLGSFLAVTFGQLVKPLDDAFEWSRTEINGFSTVMSLTLLVMAPLAGALADKFGAFKVLLVSAILFPLAVAALSLQTGSLFMFYATAVVVAAAGAATLPITYSAILVSWFDRYRGLALGIALSGTGIAFVVIPQLLQPMIAADGWRSAVQTLALISLVIVVPTVLAVLHLKPKSAAEVDGGAGRGKARHAESAFVTDFLPGGMKEQIGSARFRRVGLAFFLLSIGTQGTVVNFPPMMFGAGFTPPEVGQVMGAFGLAILSSRIIVGLLLDRLPPHLVTFIVLSAPAIGLGVLAAEVNFTTALLAAVLMGFGFGAELDIMGFFVSRLFPKEFFGKIYGVSIACYTLGAALGPLIMGAAFDLTGTYTVGLIAAAVLFFLGALQFLGLPLRRATPQVATATA